MPSLREKQKLAPGETTDPKAAPSDSTRTRATAGRAQQYREAHERVLAGTHLDLAQVLPKADDASALTDPNRPIRVSSDDAAEDDKSSFPTMQTGLITAEFSHLVPLVNVRPLVNGKKVGMVVVFIHLPLLTLHDVPLAQVRFERGKSKSDHIDSLDLVCSLREKTGDAIAIDSTRKEDLLGDFTGRFWTLHSFRSAVRILVATVPWELAGHYKVAFRRVCERLAKENFRFACSFSTDGDPIEFQGQAEDELMQLCHPAGWTSKDIGYHKQILCDCRNIVRGDILALRSALGFECSLMSILDFGIEVATVASKMLFRGFPEG